MYGYWRKGLAEEGGPALHLSSLADSEESS